MLKTERDHSTRVPAPLQSNAPHPFLPTQMVKSKGGWALVFFQKLKLLCRQLNVHAAPGMACKLVVIAAEAIVRVGFVHTDDAFYQYLMVIARIRCVLVALLKDQNTYKCCFVHTQYRQRRRYNQVDDSWRSAKNALKL